MCLHAVTGKREKEKYREIEREREHRDAQMHNYAEAKAYTNMQNHDRNDIPSFIIFVAKISLRRWHAYTIAQATMLILNRAKIS